MKSCFGLASFAISLQAAFLLDAPAVHAQEVQAEIKTEEPDTPVAPKHESKFHQMYFDDEDGKLDFSNVLARGGFFPMPVIITEPAVDGGFGLMAQFITLPKEPGGSMTRRMIGGAKTGNGSYGYGAFQSGSTDDGRISYKLGVGRGKITLTMHPKLLPNGLEYTNTYDYAVVGSARLHLADRRISFGPSVDFRQLHSKLDFDGLPDQLANALDRKLNTGALGFGLHFDSRDNTLSPKRGINVYVEGKFNAGAFGSDRDFQTYQAHGYAFLPLSTRWTLASKLELDAVRGNYPAYFAQSVNLRGVEARRYQGSGAASAEFELTRQISSRWSLLGFGGFGYADAGSKRIFDNSDVIFAGGAGFRYLIARKMGLTAGTDVAVGPGGATFYLQFGHAWGFNMD